MSENVNINLQKNVSSFSWNAGGWFGSQLGSTAWMLLASIVLLFQDSILAAVCFGCFIVMNVIGYSLWWSRDKLSAYAALQWFLLAATASFAVIILFYNSRNIVPWQTPLGKIDATMPYWGIALPPGVMLFLFVREWEARRTGTTSEPGENIRNAG